MTRYGGYKKTMVVRNIIKIDEEKCDGCGLCVPECAEGAIQIIDGKARLVKEQYCDGLAACLEHCPQDALIIEEREAEDFDEEAVKVHLLSLGKSAEVHHHHHQGVPCPSAAALNIEPHADEDSHDEDNTRLPSQLRNWPVQITLAPPGAPYFENADLLIAADCVPFAYANFHQEILKGKVVLVGCPKLDDAEFYQEKLTQIFSRSNLASITIAHMEVPCCFGLNYIVKEALSASGKDISIHEITIGVKGQKG